MPRGVSRYDEARLQQRLWSPDVLRPSLWLDAADISTITTVSGGVSQWRDKSGNNWNASQSTAANRPTYEEFSSNTALPSGAINTGLPAISFDGTNDFLELPTGFLNGATVFSVAMLLRGGYVGNNTCIFGPTNTAGTGFEFIYFNGSFFRINGTQAFGSGLYPTTGEFSITTIQASSSVTTGQNNGTPVTPNGPGITSVGFNGVYAFGRYAGGNYATMRMCEFIVSPESWSVARYQLMQGYLAWKWQLQSLLAASHPFANRPPLLGD